MTEQIFKTDVLVIGGGGAGFRAAIGAREKGVRSMLISKGPLGRCGATPMAGADFTLVGRDLKELGHDGDPNDSYEKVFNDIVTQGFYLNNQKLIDQYIRTAPQCLKELIDWGIVIRSSEERAIFTTGISIMDALVKKARSAGVELLEDMMVIDLITREGKITGALGLNIKTGEFIHFKTKAVVIATGGWHKAFWPNTGMRDLSGEGIAMASRAGADIGNMEFITFCCNILLEPAIPVAVARRTRMIMFAQEQLDRRLAQRADLLGSRPHHHPRFRHPRARRLQTPLAGDLDYTHPAGPRRRQTRVITQVRNRNPVPRRRLEHRLARRRQNRSTVNLKRYRFHDHSSILAHLPGGSRCNPSSFPVLYSLQTPPRRS